MQFRPDGSSGPNVSVPYADEARSQDGWQGQGTSRRIETLKSDIVQAMARLGGTVHGFQRGSYQIGEHERPGVQIRYSLEGPGGRMIYGRLDVAALPVRPPRRKRGARDILSRRHEASLAMALYNVVHAMRAQWVLAQLNPGYVPLMPWLLAQKDRTLTEMWADGAAAGRLLPPKAKGDDVVEGDYRET